MSALDISEALAGGPGSPTVERRCKWARLLAAVPPDQAAELTARLHGADWSDMALAKLISGTPFGVIASSALSTHRNRVCICTTYETSH